MKQNIALVLSGGAARGIAHIGVIQELEKQFNITSIAGNSMGAFIGAIYASGNLNAFIKWLDELEGRDIIRLFDPVISRQGFIKGERLFHKLDAFIPDINIEDMAIPFAVIAADITNDQEVVFRSGSLKQAIRATIAIPAVFKPVEYNNALLVDGGVVNPIPLNRVVRQQGDLLVASFVNAKIEHDDDSKTTEEKTRKRLLRNWNSTNYFKIMSKTSCLLTHSLSLMNIEKYPPDILINISRESCGNFQFHRFKQMIKIGRTAAKHTLLQHHPLCIKA